MKNLTATINFSIDKDSDLSLVIEEFETLLGTEGCWLEVLKEIGIKTENYSIAIEENRCLAHYSGFRKNGD